MTTGALILVLAAFLASAVEGVEALTVVLAVGVTRGWRSALIGAGVAVVALAVVIVALGPALALIPIDALRVVVGTLLLIFGLQWLRKAILRAAHLKAYRDEAALYQREQEEARSVAAPRGAGIDWYAFTVAFKGVFLEGLEVAFIVLTFGTSQGSIPLAALGAGIALLVVAVSGALIHQPLSRVPENTMKFAVGLMLTAFGIFWSAEGVGIVWPGADLAILYNLAFLGLASFGLVALFRSLRARQITRQAPATARVAGTGE